MVSRILFRSLSTVLAVALRPESSSVLERESIKEEPARPLYYPLQEPFSLQQQEERLESPVDVRPNNGKAADIIHFAILLRAFYGMDFKDGTYQADIVITFKWKDGRAKSVVPGGSKSVTLSQESAEKQIWMPAMAITSRDIQGTEVISTSVTVSQDGSISKVQRVIAKMKNPFSTEKYPFDEQTLQIITSSSKYMASEVKLEPLKDSKILDDAFTGKGFTMEKFDVTAYEEQSGPLIKFRGRMEVVIKRGRTKWYVGTLTAALSMVLASYGVFWLPFLGPFAMPRMALSIISYLALAQIMGAYMNNIAGVAGMSWGEFFFQTFGMLSFFAVLINIL
ncbi:unnamed protein product, partial [Effrenium voratum]